MQSRKGSSYWYELRVGEIARTSSPDQKKALMVVVPEGLPEREKKKKDSEEECSLCCCPTWWTATRAFVVRVKGGFVSQTDLPR